MHKKLNQRVRKLDRKEAVQPKTRKVDATPSKVQPKRGNLAGINREIIVFRFRISDFTIK